MLTFLWYGRSVLDALWLITPFGRVPSVDPTHSPPFSSSAFHFSSFDENGSPSNRSTPTNARIAAISISVKVVETNPPSSTSISSASPSSSVTSFFFFFFLVYRTLNLTFSPNAAANCVYSWTPSLVRHAKKDSGVGAPLSLSMPSSSPSSSSSSSRYWMPS